MARDGCSSVKQVVNGGRSVTWSSLDGPLELAAAGKMSSYSSFLSGKKENVAWRIDFSSLGCGTRRGTGGGVGVEGVDPPPSPAISGEIERDRIARRGGQIKTVEELLQSGEKLRNATKRRLKDGPVMGGPQGGDPYRAWEEQLQKTKKILSGELPLRQCCASKEDQNRAGVASLRGWLMARYRHSAALAVEFIEEVLQCESLLLLMRDMASVVEAYECGRRATAADDFLNLHRRLADTSESLRAKKAKVADGVGVSQKRHGVLCSVGNVGDGAGESSGKKKDGTALSLQRTEVVGPRACPSPFADLTTKGRTLRGSQLASCRVGNHDEKGRGCGEMARFANATSTMRSAAQRGKKMDPKSRLNAQTRDAVNDAGVAKRLQTRMPFRPSPNPGSRTLDSHGPCAARRREACSSVTRNDAGVCVPGTPCRSHESPLSVRTDWRSCYSSPTAGSSSNPPAVSNCEAPEVKKPHHKRALQISRAKETPTDPGPPSDLLGLSETFLSRAEEWFLARLELDYCDQSIEGMQNRAECLERLEVIRKGQRWLDRLPEPTSKREDVVELRLLMSDTALFLGSSLGNHDRELCL